MLDLSAIRFDDKGLVPAVAQDFNTFEVLMLAYMNREALEKTIESRKAHYWSRGRGSLWLKGETSGNFQEVKSIYYDCDADTLLLMVEPRGPACHTGERTCFFRRIDEWGGPPPRPERVIKELFLTIKERKGAPPDKSYVASLYSKGRGKILEKIAEESDELIEAAGAKTRGDVLYEFCDLLFHSLVLLVDEGIEIEEVYSELRRRSGVSGIEEKASRGRPGGGPG
ncbi:MAG: bifunctional phosphoribosyl-AMP cyclohydrolase/phosphoribosyl-ATP diphosphatase HisIE [Deltaproteobacteria bacterium]|nr:bifunctional phosphoribosyl-AMP cyclohydrolase/phosphoribosyl-ATP diphosphatase HisIE [Deltaproteobacteria bacterium]